VSDHPRKKTSFQEIREALQGLYHFAEGGAAATFPLSRNTMTPSPAPIALFDFDGTLTRRDSLPRFLHYCMGSAVFWKTMATQWKALLALKTGRMPRGLVKQQVLGSFFAGWPMERLESLGAAFARDIIPGMLRGPSMPALKQHLHQGHTCYLVSASLDLYLRPWSQSQGMAGALCTRLEVSPAGILTGRLQGLNVYGPEKVARIKEALGESPDIECAYGDSRGDLEMLDLARHAWMRGRVWKNDRDSLC
jgi:HAD superfamily hydrolase (TIGR01490 family)